MQRSQPAVAPSLLETLTTERLDLLLLLALWVLLLWAGGQVPQADIPLAHTDGASRADLLAVQGLGLHRIAGSLPAWLLAATTVFVAIARGVAAVATSSDHSSPSPRPADVAGADSHGDRYDAIATKLMAIHPGFRPTKQGGFCLGYGAIGRGLLGFGVILCATGWLLSGVIQPAVVLQTDASGRVAAHRAEAGRPGSVVPITGRCDVTPASGAARQRLACTLMGTGLAGPISLEAGAPAHVGPNSLTWVANSPGASGDRGRLRWRRAIAGGPAAWYGFNLPVGAAVDIPDLHARAALIAAGNAGPVVAAAVDHRAFIAASPGLVRGRATMRLDPTTRQRLRFGPTVSTWWWLVGGALVLAGLVLIAFLPVAVVRVDGGAIALGACNSSALRGRIERALDLTVEPT